MNRPLTDIQQAQRRRQDRAFNERFERELARIHAEIPGALAQVRDAMAQAERDQESIAAMRAIDPGDGFIRFDDVNGILAQIREQVRAHHARPVLCLVPEEPA